MKKYLDRIFTKMGLIAVCIKKNPEYIESIKRSSGIHHLDVTFYIGTKNSGVAILLGHKWARKIKSLQRKINTFKSHFDDKYTLDDRNTPAKQIFRWVYGDDSDSVNEFAVMWAPRYTRGELANLLAYEWEGGCSCSYDCCGHWFTNVWSHKAKKFGPIHVVFFGHGRNV